MFLLLHSNDFSGANDHPLLYRLYAVVVHVDMLNASFFGHYICFVKDSNGVWYKIDDRKVKEVDLGKVLTQRAYMLFYCRSGARKAPNIEEHPSAILATSHSVPKKTRTSVCMETQRSSIFPPTLGAIPVPTDFSRDYPNDSELIQLKQSEEETEVHDRKIPQNSEDIIATEDKSAGETVKEISEMDLGPVSTNVSEEEEPAEESRSSVALGLSFDLITSAPNVTSSSQTLNCNLPSNNNLKQNRLSSDATSDDLDRGKIKLTNQQHSLLPSSKSLGVDRLMVFSCVENDDLSPHSQVLNFGGMSSSISAWVSGTDDLLPSNLHSMCSNYSAVSSPHGTFAGHERRSLNEADAWNDYVSNRVKRQHIEESPEKLGSAGACLNGDSQYMDVDEGSASTVDDDLNPHTSFEVLFNDGAGRSSVLLDTCRTSGNRELFRSSAALLELESLHSRSALQLTSSIKNQGAGIEPMGSTEPSGESSSFLKPLRSRVLTEELPRPAVDIRKVTSTVRVTRSGTEIHEESFDVGPIEDDIPYVFAKPLFAEPAIPQFCEGPCDQQPDKSRRLTKTPTVEMQDSVLGAADGVPIPPDTISYVDVEENQCKIDTLIWDVKRTNQSSKPLFRPGFLIKRSKSNSSNSMSCTDAFANDRSEAIGQGHFIEVCQDPSNGIPASAPVTNGTGIDPQRSITNGKLISNRNYSDGKSVSRKKPKDSPLENSPIIKDQSESTKYKNVKQRRNDSCACGSQQKWKKCCGKASVLKGGLVTKQVIV